MSFKASIQCVRNRPICVLFTVFLLFVWIFLFCVCVIIYGATTCWWIKIFWRKLDSMRWFSHRRSQSPPGGAQWYRLLLHAACCVRSSYGARPSMHCQWGWLSSFSFFVPGDLGLWPLTLTFELRPDFCTMYLTAKFDRPMFSRSEVMARTNILTNWQTNKQTPLKTSTALRYATSEDKNLRRRLCEFCRVAPRHGCSASAAGDKLADWRSPIMPPPPFQLHCARHDPLRRRTTVFNGSTDSLRATQLRDRPCVSATRDPRRCFFHLTITITEKCWRKMNQRNRLSGKTIERIYYTLSSFKNNLIFVLYTSDDYNASLFNLFPQRHPKLDSQVAWIINKNCSSLRSIRTQAEKM